MNFRVQLRTLTIDNIVRDKQSHKIKSEIPSKVRVRTYVVMRNESSVGCVDMLLAPIHTIVVVMRNELFGKGSVENDF